MKTTANKLIVLAVATFLGLTLNAQNTKSVKLNHFKGHLAELVSEKMVMAKAEMVAGLESLEAFVRYTPAEINVEPYETESAFDIDLVEDQLENFVKFVPKADYEANYEYKSDSEGMNETLMELEEVVKFKPNDYNPDYYGNAWVADIVNELERVVKYQPAKAI
jgi:hypothetical protein